MKKTLACLALIAALCFAGGCNTIPHEQLKAQADARGYGADPIRSQWQTSIKAYMLHRLKDPDSAQYQFGEPYRGWLTAPPIKGGGLTNVGYIVEVSINAKNSYGGYTGYQRYKFFFRDNQVQTHATLAAGQFYWL